MHLSVVPTLLPARWRAVAAGTGLALLAAAPAPAAAGSGHCRSVSGAAAGPGWTLVYDPGLTAAPTAQRVWIEPHGQLVAALHCASPAGDSTFWVLLDVWGSRSTSTVESLAAGSGQFTDMYVWSWWNLDDGPRPQVSGRASVGYARAGSAMTLTVALRDLRVDDDGWGPHPEQSWGDLTLTAATVVDGGAQAVVDGQQPATGPARRLTVAPSVLAGTA